MSISTSKYPPLAAALSANLILLFSMKLFCKFVTFSFLYIKQFYEKLKLSFQLYSILDYHDPCYGKGVCVSAVQCPSRYRENATQCYLGHYTVGLCCNAILENPGMIQQ